MLTSTPSPGRPGTALLLALLVLASGPALSADPAGAAKERTRPLFPSWHEKSVPSAFRRLTRSVSDGTKLLSDTVPRSDIWQRAQEQWLATSGTYCVCADHWADLHLALSDLPDPVIAGESLAYAVFVENLGPDHSGGIVIEQVLPPQAVFTSALPGPPTCNHFSGTVTCDYGTLLAGEATTITVRADVLPGTQGTITSQALVTAVTFDPVSSNDFGSATTGVLLPGPGAVPDGASGVPLRIGKSLSVPGELDLSWGTADCDTVVTDYSIHQGVIGDWPSHAAFTCSTSGATVWSIQPDPGDRYYLIVPLSDDVEGSYGRDGSGNERPPSLAACRIDQVVDACP